MFFFTIFIYSISKQISFHDFLIVYSQHKVRCLNATCEVLARDTNEGASFLAADGNFLKGTVTNYNDLSEPFRCVPWFDYL